MSSTRGRCPRTEFPSGSHESSCCSGIPASRGSITAASLDVSVRNVETWELRVSSSDAVAERKAATAASASMQQAEDQTANGEMRDRADRNRVRAPEQHRPHYLRGKMGSAPQMADIRSHGMPSAAPPEQPSIHRVRRRSAQYRTPAQLDTRSRPQQPLRNSQIAAAVAMPLDDEARRSLGYWRRPACL